jgi:hypothetical protein
MVKNPHILEQFERDLARKTKPSYRRNVKIVNKLLEFAIAQGKFPPKDPLEGIEVDVEYARAINGVRRKSR